MPYIALFGTGSRIDNEDFMPVIDCAGSTRAVVRAAFFR